MTAITQTITAYSGTVPDKDNQTASQFSDNADDFVAYIDSMEPELNTFSTQANSLRTDVNGYSTDAETAKDSAEDAESVSLASANFEGEWDDLTGALNVPASCYHDNKFWMLISDLADVTAKEPGVDVEWEELISQNPWERKTANFNADVNKKYKVGDGLTATLPASPADNDQIWFSPLEDLVASNSTIGRNGKKIMGSSADMTYDVNAPFSLVYDSTLTDWRLA